MHLHVMGKLESEDQLPSSVLPEGAVRFDEPDTMKDIAWASARYLPPTLLATCIIYVAGQVLGRAPANPFTWPGLWGLVFTFAFIPAHELLHAVCLPREAEAQMWYSFTDALCFIYSPAAVTKTRFIIMCAAPNVVLAWAPMLLWLVLPLNYAQSSYLFCFAALMAINGIGDYMNIHAARTQMPRGALEQMSGIHSYWFMPGAGSASTDDDANDAK